MDPVHRELFTVNNDVEDRLVVFDYDARGNVKPKRLLYVPHQSWGIAFNRKRDEIALSVQTPNMFVVFKRDAQKFDAPIRSVRGPADGMADPHGIYFDETHNEVVRRQPRQLPPGRADHVLHRVRRARIAAGAHRQRLQRNARGRFVPSSLTVYDGDAQGRRRAAPDDPGPLEPARLADGRRGRRGQQRDLRREQRRQLGACVSRGPLPATCSRSA